jgi:hypothetical protein
MMKRVKKKQLLTGFDNLIEENGMQAGRRRFGTLSGTFSMAITGEGL